MHNSTNYNKHTQSKGLRRRLINAFNERLLHIITTEIKVSESFSLLDLGCGEGFILSMIKNSISDWDLTGCDISAAALEIAEKAVPSAKFIKSDAAEVGLVSDDYDLVLCSEVLEHMKEPITVLKEISRLTRKYVLLTVPHEPFFCMGNLASLKYLPAFGNHPEHIQHFTKGSFRKLCNQYFHEKIYTGSFPWLIYLGEKK